MKATPYFDNITQTIIQRINSAKKEIQVAVAWLTNEELVFALAKASDSGVRVEIIVSASMSPVIKNNADTIIRFLRSRRCSIFKIGVEKDDRAALMHHKFCIIDSRVVINGSFNWTKKASINDENIIVIEDKKTALSFKDTFNELRSRILPERLWFSSLSYLWQSKLKSALGIDNEPTDEDLKAICRLEVLDVSGDPLRKCEEEDIYNSLMENAEEGDVEYEEICRWIASCETQEISDLSPVSYLKNLRELNCASTDVKSLEPLARTNHLERLDISGISSHVLDLTYISHLKSLKVLICGCTNLRNWDAVAMLTNLEEVRFISSSGSYRKTWSITDLEVFRNKTELKILDISGLQVCDLSPLNNCLGLEELHADHTLIQDLEPLYSLPKLREIHFHETDITEEVLKMLAHNNSCFRQHEENRKVELKTLQEEYERSHQEFLKESNMTEEQYRIYQKEESNRFQKETEELLKEMGYSHLVKDLNFDSSWD